MNPSFSVVPLTDASAEHLRNMKRVGIDILSRQGRSYHERGFAQDVLGTDGQLIHAELNDDGFWRCEDADTGEFLGYYVGIR